MDFIHECTENRVTEEHVDGWYLKLCRKYSNPSFISSVCFIHNELNWGVAHRATLSSIKYTVKDCLWKVMLALKGEVQSALMSLNTLNNVAFEIRCLV